MVALVASAALALSRCSAASIVPAPGENRLKTPSSIPTGTGHSIWDALRLLLPEIVVGWRAGSVRWSKRKARESGLIALLLVLTWSLLCCGGVSTGVQPLRIVYSDIQITVAGTSPGTAIDAGQNTIVTLVVD